MLNFVMNIHNSLSRGCLEVLWIFCGSPGESNKVILNVSPGERNEVPLHKNGYELLLKEAGKLSVVLLEERKMQK